MQPSFFFLPLAFLLSLPSPVLATEPPKLDRTFCKALVAHHPDSDVTYKAGYDVNGNPVPPADLPTPTPFPLKIEIPLTLNLAKALNLNTTQYPFNLMKKDDINLGTLKLEGERVTLQGHPLEDEQQKKLAILCLHNE